MKILFFITLLLIINTCFAQQSRKSSFYSNNGLTAKILNQSSEIPKYGKLEVGLQIPFSINKLFLMDSLNPFDSEAINIEANFVSKNGEISKKVFGFYYEEFTVTDNKWVAKFTPYNWRIRFSPNKIGSWLGYIKVETLGQTFLDTLHFECLQSNNKGFVEVGNKGNKTDRYLRFSESKETFFAIGENMVWPSFQKLKPQDVKKQFKWMTELADNGGNFIRLGLTPESFGFEWEKLGNYKNRMQQAWEFDNTFDLANELELYLLLWLDIHGQFTPPPWKGEKNSWNSNPYHTQLKQINTPIDFLTDTEARTYYKRKVRYLTSRWGYSTNLAIYEPLSEIDNFLRNYNKSGTAAKKERQIINDWYLDLKNYMTSELSENRPVSVSFTGGEADKIEEKIFSHADITFLHKYDSNKDANKKRFYKVQTILKHKNTQFKPILFNELGAEHTPNLDYADDITLHNEIWSTSFSGAFGCGMTWWWDNAIHSKGWQKNFKGLHTFFKNEDLTSMEFSPKFWQSNFWSFYKSELEMYYLKSNDNHKVIGWLHNNSYWWRNKETENSEIKNLLNINNKRLDKGDLKDYSKVKRYKKLDPGNTNAPIRKNKTLKFKKLNRKSNYIVNWYNTTTGLRIPELQQKVKTKGRKVKFEIPKLAKAYGDYGFKITLVK